MKQKILKVFLLIIALSSIIISCNPDVGGEPVLELLTDSKYTYKNDSIAPGDSVLFGLKCTWNGADVLQRIFVSVNDSIRKDTIEIESFDSEGVAFGVKYEKSALEKDSFIFELIDAASNMASRNLLLYSDTSQSDLRNIAGIDLGAQNNTEIYPLYSISKQKSYSLAEAETEATQKLIDFIGAYSAENNFYIGSPATDFGGIYSFSWTEKNATEFITYTDENYGTLNKTKIKALFDAEDANILTKTNALAEEDMYLFHTQAGKYGVLKVNSVTDGEDGLVNFNIKVER